MNYTVIRIAAIMLLTVAFPALSTQEDVNALCRAALRAQIQTINFLASQGTDVNLPGNPGKGYEKLGELPPIFWTTLNSSRSAAQAITALTKWGADVNQKAGPLGGTPINYATLNPYCQFSTVETLVSRGADINAQCTDGQTPLHAAYLMDNQPIISFLRDKGASIALKDEKGRTPLDFKHPILKR